ncbi:M50 family metallopeptidase [Candidatus Uhrbacteria bacterium]|nr:M50 family metallopeptidase [Candidatus Uhrbacteria bacterium]
MRKVKLYTWLLFVYLFLIAVHELAHAYTAVYFGIEVREISLGFGPTIHTFETTVVPLSLRSIPLGAFVTLAGEPKPPSLTSAQLCLIALAGPGLNWCIGFMSGIFSQNRRLFYIRTMRLGFTNSPGHNRGSIIELLKWSLLGHFFLLYILLRMILSSCFNIDSEKAALQIEEQSSTEFIQQNLNSIMTIAFALGAFNMMPLIPVDGGRIVKELLTCITPMLGTIFQFLSISLFSLVFTYTLFPSLLHRKKEP